MTDKEKIREYLKIKGILPTEFYRNTGLSNGFLDSGKGIGSDKLKIIISHYPDLNLKWLLFDEGDMILKEKNDDNNYYKPFNQIDVLNEYEKYHDPVVLYLEKQIAKKDQKILELHEKMILLKEKLRDLNQK